MKIKLGTLRAIIRETLQETRPWGRAIGAEWDEPDGEKWDRIEYYKKKAREKADAKAKARAHALATVPQPKKDEPKTERDGAESWIDKAKRIAMTDLGGPEGFLTPANKATRHGQAQKGPSDEFRKWQEKRNKKQEVSETGAYYGKTMPAMGAILGGNDQKPTELVCPCGDPECPGCEEDYSDWEGPADIGEPPVMCWCGDRDCSHYE